MFYMFLDFVLGLAAGNGLQSGKFSSSWFLGSVLLKNQSLVVEKGPRFSSQYLHVFKVIIYSRASWGPGELLPVGVNGTDLEPRMGWPCYTAALCVCYGQRVVMKIGISSSYSLKWPVDQHSGSAQWLRLGHLTGASQNSKRDYCWEAYYLSNHLSAWHVSTLTSISRGIKSSVRSREDLLISLWLSGLLVHVVKPTLVWHLQ